MTDTHRPPPLLTPYLLVTAFVCGALIMVVEVLGSRVIGPFFGVSLFVWTSLIAVTLIALAGGYGVGGLLSDRWSTPGYLFAIIGAAGALVLLIPLLKGPVLQACVGLGLRWGAFTSTLLLFGPPLFLLGCVSPYLAKIVTRELTSIGRVVGGLYALSTVGSIAGTVLTGFILIAYLGIDRIFTLTGALLLGLSAGYFLLFRRRWQALLLLALPFALGHSDTVESRLMANGTRATQVHGEDSHYGNIKVVDYSYGELHTRELIIDGLVQGGIDMRSGLSIYGYAYLMQFLPYLLNPGGDACLVIGLGAGIVPRWYESQGVRADVVDIDPAIVAVARDYFDFATRGEVAIADARYFLISTDKRYDYIVLDVFNGDITPGHLVSLEAMGLIRERLEPGGVVAINLVGSLREHTLMTFSVVRTLRAVFDNVEIYPTFDPAGDDATGNLAIIAYQGAPRRLDRRRVEAFQVHPWAIKELAYLHPYAIDADAPAMVLTDDYNPIDFYDSWLRERVRREILKTTDWGLLTGGSG